MYIKHVSLSIKSLINNFIKLFYVTLYGDLSEIISYHNVVYCRQFANVYNIFSNSRV